MDDAWTMIERCMRRQEDCDAPEIKAGAFLPAATFLSVGSEWLLNHWRVVTPAGGVIVLMSLKRSHVDE